MRASKIETVDSDSKPDLNAERSSLSLDPTRHNGMQAFLDFFSVKSEPGDRILLPLFLVSFAALYIEILLIRWIGTEIRVFAYFQNLALIACFLGFGLGCYRAGRKKGQLFDAGAIAFLIIFVELPVPQWKRILEGVSSALSYSNDAQLWSAFPELYGESPLIPFVASAVVATGLIYLVVSTMIPLGQWVGTYLDAARNPVSAYTSNLAGSLVGIWFFAGLSALRTSPVIWLGVAFLLLVLLRQRSKGFGLAGLLLFAASLILLHHAYSGSAQTYWSPYQKLQVDDEGEQRYNILVNNTGYMSIANLTPEFLNRHPDAKQEYPNSSYDAPFRFVERRDRVLIIGAGAGNDAAAALRNGAGEVDAVEIDPVIYALGKALHPDHPYNSPRVHLILNDARNYLRRASVKYDVVIFGLLDSHTQSSSYSNMRLHNYVYTEEAFREAKGLLKPTGVLILKFEVRGAWAWMGERFYSTFDHLFGRPPVVFAAPLITSAATLPATEFLAANDSDLWQRAAQPELAAFLAANPPPFSPNAAPPPAVTDDWPYVYHRGHSIPRAYLAISLILFAMALLMTRRKFAVAKISTWNFFFLGAGFLLLETQMVSRLALYFGATWWVNCVALSAILITLVAANFWVEWQKPERLVMYYVALIVCLIAIYVVPWTELPFSSRVVGMFLAAAYGFPIFCAGVIFTESFRRCEDKSGSFGSNIVGAVVGGLAQNVSFMIGLKALLLLAAVLYLLAALCGSGWEEIVSQRVSSPRPVEGD
jgi:spermidine synthase